MATWDDVRRIAGDLPGLEEVPDRLEWKVRGKTVLWNRPLRGVDMKALGEAAPDGTIIGIRVPDVADQQALVQNGPDAVFITPHFEGWPGVLVELERIPIGDLEELIIEGWLTQAPKIVTQHWLEHHGIEDDP